MSKGTLSRLSALAMLSCLFLTLNLHGCGQFYRDSTQQNWLVNFEKYTTAETASHPPGDSHAAPSSDVGVFATSVSGQLSDPHLGELSGLAASGVHLNRYWAINDSGNPSDLYSMSANGQVSSVHSLPFRNRDWEALDQFTVDGVSWLLVADTGDNLARRAQSQLYIFPEPDPVADLPVTDVKRVRFGYEGGPQNVEAVAVSVLDNAIYFIAKNATNPEIFSLPLDTAMETDKPMTARRVGSIQPLQFTRKSRVIERVLASRLLLGPTGFDISDDEQLAVVGNYRHVYLYRRGQAQSWEQALRQPPETIATHRLAQSESVAFGADAMVLVGSEGMQAPLLRIEAVRSSDTTDIDIAPEALNSLP